MNEYPLITYLDKTNGVAIKKDARKITKHLVVSYANEKKGDLSIKIYSLFGHKEIMPHTIATYQDSIKFCLFLEEQYGEYWNIHQLEEYQDFDIIQVAQYSVDNGERTFVALKELETKDTITFSDFQSELDKLYNEQGESLTTNQRVS